MPSTYSPDLRIELIANGEQSGTWGTTTNVNLGTLIEDAIAGYVSVSITSANQALTANNGTADQARNMVVNLTTTTAANFNVYVPPVNKFYVIRNSSAYEATIFCSTVIGNTTAAGTGAIIPAGAIFAVFSDGVNVVQATGNVVSGGTGQISYAVGDILFASTSTELSKLADVATGNALISGGVGVAPSYGKIGLTTHISGTLPVANGGTGVTSSTGTGSVVLSDSPTLVTPALGTPASGTVTNLTGTASININGTVGATTPSTGAFTSVTSTSVTTTGASGVLTRAAATQDGVELIGRAGGTTSLKVTLTPTTLTASRTLTLPNNSGTILTSGAAVTVSQGGTGQTTYTDGQLLIGNTTGNTLAKATLTGTANQVIVTNGAGSITLSGPQDLATTSDVQFDSFGVGTAASGTTGEIRATDNVVAHYSSDRTLKENIRDIPDALNKACAIGGKLFDWTDAYIEAHGGVDGYFVQKSDFGVIAQDVQGQLPVAVRTRDDGTLAVDYEKMCALAFAAIKELRDELNSLKKEFK